MKAPYHDVFEPVHPCREMPTRHCPAVYKDVCGSSRPCARFESWDETPWRPEIEAHECAGYIVRRQDSPVKGPEDSVEPRSVEG